jgi:hypothetical protein
VVREVHSNPVEAVRDIRTGHTSRCVVWSEHKVIDEKLRAPFEELHQRGAAVICLEAVVDPNPRQLLPLPCQFVAAPRELLLRVEQFEPRCEPLFASPGVVRCHRPCLLPVVALAAKTGPLGAEYRKIERGPDIRGSKATFIEKN